MLFGALEVVFRTHLIFTAARWRIYVKGTESGLTVGGFCPGTGPMRYAGIGSKRKYLSDKPAIHPRSTTNDVNVSNDAAHASAHERKLPNDEPYAGHARTAS